MQVDPICPRCTSIRCSRIHRQGLLQTYLLPALGFYPWECSDCRKVFSSRKRGKRRQRRDRSESAGQPTSE